MDWRLLAIVCFCTIALAQPFSTLGDTLNQTSSAELQFKLPPDDFHVRPRDVGQQVSIPVEQASLLLLSLIREAWTRNDPLKKIPTNVQFDEDKFGWSLSYSVRNFQADKYANLQSVAWTAIAIANLHLYDDPTQVDENNWLFPEKGYLVEDGRMVSVAGCVVHTTSLALPANSTLSDASKGSDLLSTNAFNSTVQPIALSVDATDPSLSTDSTRVEVSMNGPLLDKQSVIEHLWYFVWQVLVCTNHLSCNAQAKVSTRYQAGDVYSRTFESVETRIIFNTIKDSSHDVVWSDVMQTISNLLARLSAFSTWRTFQARSFFTQTSHQFLTIEMRHVSTLSANSTTALGPVS